MAVPEVDRALYKKYDIAVPHRLNFYVFFQYLFTAAGGAAFLFMAEQLPMVIKAIAALLIVVAIVNCSALFELRKWVYLAEFARIICTVTFV